MARKSRVVVTLARRTLRLNPSQNHACGEMHVWELMVYLKDDLSWLVFFLNYNRYRNDPLVLERTLREGFADQGHYVSRCEMGTPSKWRHCDVIQHQVALVMFQLLEAWHGLIPGNMFQLFWLALQGWKAKTRRNCTWEPEKLRFKKHRSSNVCVAKYDSNMV